MSAGTVDFSSSQVHRSVRKYVFSWTSSAGGGASGFTEDVTGEILRVVFVPGSGGVQPSDNYAATLLDADGIDVLAGQGGSLSHSSTTHVKPSVPMKEDHDFHGPDFRGRNTGTPDRERGSQ